ncbi:MAG: hypothetical protein PF513_00040 [Tenericutes bacterium]|nr:hypothetical protein [Mycoplasmatota bacterium]
MKRKILNVVSIVFIILGLVYFALLGTIQSESIESSLQMLSASLILSVFIAGAIYHLLRKD